MRETDRELSIKNYRPICMPAVAVRYKSSAKKIMNRHEAWKDIRKNRIRKKKGER